MTTATITPVRTDAKIDAFCSAKGPEIFRPIAYPTEVCSPDPLDVGAIHSEARDLFDVLLSRATNPDDPNKIGRIILLRGEAGSGKTHLMRAFRTRAHRQGLGYFSYMQMTTSTGNYSRYILHNLIESLDTPYYNTPDSPDLTTGLHRLSTAVAESPLLDRGQVRHLREDGLEFDECANLVLDLADEAVRDPLLRDVPIDLIIAMLFLQSEHPALHSRVMKYLRAEPLSNHDRTKLAGISPLDRDESAQVMIERLGHLMWSLHGASLLLSVDQLEDIMVQDGAAQQFPRAIKGLVKVAENVPSSLIIISCLDDYYDSMRGHLDSSTIDRIEKDPAPIKLSGRRSWDEIEKLVGTHLEHLYDHFDIATDDIPSTYPVPQRMLREHVRQTTRNILTACKEYRERCMIHGNLVAAEQITQPMAAPQEPICNEPFEHGKSLVALDQAWNDFLANFEQAPPDSDAALAALLSMSIDLCSDEVDEGYEFTTEARQTQVGVHIRTDGNVEPVPSFVAAICNKSPSGGGLGGQVEAVLQHTSEQPSLHTPVIVRSTEYTPKTPKSKIAKLFARLYASDGRYVIVPDSNWRTMAAMQVFRNGRQAEPQFSEWLRSAKPLTRLEPIRRILRLDDLAHRPQTQEGDHGKDGLATAHNAPDVERHAGEQGSREGSQHTQLLEKASNRSLTNDLPDRVMIGHSRGRNQAQVDMPCGDWKRHTAFLGGTGSGKTTAALNVIEQLLIKGIPALLVDRKGDLVSYAREELWQDRPDDSALAERQRLLRERLDVAVYTPGHSGGRAIRLPVAPDHLGEMKSAERQHTVRQAAYSLGQMLGYKTTTGKGGKHISVMVKAIELMAELGYESITLDGLIEYINERDDALISAIGVLDVKLFDSLLEDLQMLSINRQLLFPTEGESLCAEELFGLGPAARPGRTRLSVISTKFLGDTGNIQFWVAQLLLELTRWTSKRPSVDLQAVVLFDEADMYLPATSKPASKEPMEGLLKRARSAGLGVMLATQSPGDFDYKSRENINTWFIGKIKEDTAIKKMKPMLSELKRDIGSDLSGQKTGDFFLIRNSESTAIHSQRSLVETEQLREDEILGLALKSQSKPAEGSVAVSDICHATK